MISLEKIRSLPEKTRKIILWAILIVLASIMLFFWIGRIPERLNDFQAGRFIEQLDLPKIEIPKIEIPNASSTQEN